jgi:hypothetical protein
VILSDTMRTSETPNFHTVNAVDDLLNNAESKTQDLFLLTLGVIRLSYLPLKVNPPRVLMDMAPY